jgi:hypothetical protein
MCFVLHKWFEIEHIACFQWRGVVPMYVHVFVELYGRTLACVGVKYMYRSGDWR